MYDDLYGELMEQSWYEVIPIMLLVFLVPLLVRGKIIELTGDYFKYWNGSDNSVDFFCYYKAIAIVILAIALLIILIIKFLKKDVKLKKTTIYIPMGIYVLISILSTVCSNHTEISLFGYIERYEGILVIFSYMIILFVTINMVNEKNKIKSILFSLLFSAVLIGIIGILQYFGHDFFKTSLGKSCILPQSVKNATEQIRFEFGDKIIYSTLYHYNYVGSYMAMLFPLTFTIAILIKNKVYKILLSVVSLLMFLNLILCHSRAGIIGGLVAGIILCGILRKVIVNNWKGFVGILLVSVMIFIGFNHYSKGMLKSRIGSLFSDGESLKNNNKNFYIKDIYSKENVLRIETNKSNLTIDIVNNKLNFVDDKSDIVPFSINNKNNQIKINRKEYEDFNIRISDASLSSINNNLELVLDNTKIPILIENGKFKFKDKRRGIFELKKVGKFGFEGKERIGSARGYIWSRSIPLIKHSVVLGYGPDTFAVEFPQTDFVGKIVAYDRSNILIDKPHNLYLQQAINTGVISLLAFLSMFVMYFISCIKLYFKSNFDDFYSIVGVSIFTAICGYLGAGFFNDSVVSVAPVFWVLFGMGISMNYRLKKDFISAAEGKN